MDLLNNLNDKQREAAMHTKGPLLILAGAGSGKTSTMTHRIAYLIKEKGVSPHSIFAVTFTNKAAGEMRERVESLVGSARGMWIMTFHAACLRMLRYDAEAIGYKKDFTVYDPTDQKAVIKGCLKARNIDDKRFSPAYVLSVISDCKEKDIDPRAYYETNGGEFRADTVAKLYEDYEAVLHKNNAMDFDDLLRNAVKLLSENPEILSKYQERFEYIMVDEYQDTNYIQYRLVKMLADKHHNICVVGDDDQCIYQWRGADIKNILSFEKDFKGTKVIKLEQNYRSYGNILEGAHSVISKNRSRKEKKLWTEKPQGEKIKYYRADSEKDEARYVAQEVERLRGLNPCEDGKLKYRDFAILYRTNAQSRSFEDSLIARDIPYRVLGGLRYYDRKEIKDMMAYMRLVLNPDDDLALARIINEPKRGVGDKTLEKLRGMALAQGKSMLLTLADQAVTDCLGGKAGAAVNSMARILLSLSREKDNLRVSDIYDQLLAKTGYLAALEEQQTVESEGRIENILEFKSAIVDYEKEDIQLSLSDFLEKIALMAEVDNHDPDEDAVVLMTLHSAKGLEFPVVFMVGMEDGLFPGWRSMDSEDGISEERRLCYVGMTRAKRLLYLSSAEVRTMYGKTDFTRESMFLREIDKKLIDGDGIYEPSKVDRLKIDTGKSRDGYSGEVFKPFDSLKYVRAELAAKTSSAANDKMSLQAGDKVNHAKFGDGLVVDVAGKTVTVIFDSAGTKKLAIDLAPLKKL